MRKQTTYIVADDNRDRGKTFQITEMACDKAEKWALRALSAAARAGVDVGSLPVGGMAGVAAVGIEGLFRVSFEEAEPLLDELFTCVKIVRDPAHPEMTFALIEEDIEEVTTRLRLRTEVLKLHLDFSPGVSPSTSKTSETTPKPNASSNVKTPPGSSAQRSRITRRR